MVPGFTTTMRTRPLLVAKIEEFVRSKEVQIKSGRLIDELESLDIISGHNGSKPREVLKDRMQIDDIFNQ